MRFGSISIHNYKSLRNVSITLAPLTVIVGANAAGKSNFCDALDFLAEAYRLGLEVAISRKGGYENICYRRLRRSKAPIKLAVEFETTAKEWQSPFLPRLAKEVAPSTRLILHHEFEIKAESENISAPFHVETEALHLRVPASSAHQPSLPPPFENLAHSNLLSIIRRGSAIVNLDFKGLDQLAGGESPSRILKSLFEDMTTETNRQHVPSTELIVSILDSILFGASSLRRSIGSLRVFQLNPRTCREAGVPTPNPELDRYGANLPAVIEHMRGNFPEEYESLLQSVRAVMPSLEGLSTQYTHTKTLGLFVSEEGVGRPWAAEDISDGTIQTIALLAAIFDPRITIAAIEEPENSVHPWALRKFIEAARKASTSKQVILTTHSPVLINQLKPSELWIARRVDTETKLDPLLSFDPTVEESWGEGHFTLAEYLDSGAIPEAVPG